MPVYVDIGRTVRIAPLNQRQVVDRSDAGTIRLLDTGAADLYAITVEHPFLNATERASFWAFFASARFGAITITPAGSGDSYSVYFDGVPVEEQLSASRWSIAARLVGNKL